MSQLPIYEVETSKNKRPRDVMPLPRPWYNTTRREAVIGFLISLQSPLDGGFRWSDPYTNDDGGTGASYEALRTLYLLNATDRINEPFFMYFVNHLWVEWTYKGTPMGGFLPFIMNNWDFKNGHISIMDTDEVLNCLSYLGRLNDVIDNDKRTKIINYVLSLYDNETGKFYIGYDGGFLNEIEDLVEIWSAVDILYLLDALDLIDKNKVAQAIMSFYVCYNDTYGVFEDEWGWNVQTEVAIKSLYLLKRLYLVPREKLINSIKLVYDNTTGGTIDHNPGTLETVLTVLYYLNALGIVNRSKTIDWVLDFQDPFHFGAFAFPGSDPDTTTNLYCVTDLYYLNATDVLDEPYKVRDLPPPPPSGPPPSSGNENEGNSNSGSSSGGSNNQSTVSDAYGFVFGLILIIGFALLIAMFVKIVEINWRRIRKILR